MLNDVLFKDHRDFLDFLGLTHSCIKKLYVGLYTDITESTEHALKLSACCPILCKACRHGDPSSIPQPAHVKFVMDRVLT